MDLVSSVRYPKTGQANKGRVSFGAEG